MRYAKVVSFKLLMSRIYDVVFPFKSESDLSIKVFYCWARNAVYLATFHQSDEFWGNFVCHTFFIFFGYYLYLERFSKSKISISKISDILDSISYCSKPANSNSKSKSWPFFWINSSGLEYIRVNHPCTQNFHPFW